jgi:hypothetical protein
MSRTRLLTFVRAGAIEFEARKKAASALRNNAYICTGKNILNDQSSFYPHSKIPSTEIRKLGEHFVRGDNSRRCQRRPGSLVPLGVTVQIVVVLTGSISGQVFTGLGLRLPRR